MSVQEPSSINGEGDAAAMLERLRTRLLDLTLSNRLLNFKPSGARVVRVIDELPDQLFERLRGGAELEIVPVPEPPPDHPLRSRASGSEKAARQTIVAAFAAELGLATSFDLPPAEKATAEKHADDAVQTLLFPSDLEKSLRAIASDARSALEEKGSNILYMIFGFLEWYESESSEKIILSPLVMLPVTLRRGEPDRKTGAYRFFISYSNEDVLPNISLQEKLRRDFRLTLPDLEEDERPEKYLARIAATVPLPPRWRIRRQASLGMLAFSKLFMYRDLDPRQWPPGKGPADHERVAELLGLGGSANSPSGDAYDGEYDFEGSGLGPTPSFIPPIILDADSSQHSAIVDAFAGRSLVIEGPPGTGKSQTIANLIAAAMDAGKTVLFVAEKLTALEVVRRRLDETGLGAFCLELHSDKTQKSRLVDDLKRRLELRGTFRSPAELEQRTRVLSDLRQRLNSHATRMNAPTGAMGWKVHDVLWGTRRRRSILGAQSEAWTRVSFPSADSLTLDQYEDLRRCASAFGGALTHARSGGPLSAHPFWGLWSAHTDPAFEHAIVDALEHLHRASSKAIADIDALSAELDARSSTAPEFLEALVARAKLLHEPACRAVMGGAIAISGDDTRVQFRQWLEDLANYQELRRRMDEEISDMTIRTAVADLSYDTFKGIQHSASLAEIIAAPTTAQKAKSDLQLAFKLAREVSGVIDADLPPTLSAAQMARDLVECAARAPFDALGHRGRMDERIDGLLEVGAERAAQLIEELATLDEEFHVSLAPDSEVLEAHASTCASAGLFSFFSGAYRAAKRQYVTLSRQSTKASNSHMADGFRALAAHVKARGKFEGDPELTAALGSSFRGLDTQFDKVATAREWQKTALSLHRKHRRVAGAASIADAPAELLRDLAMLQDQQRLLPSQLAAHARQVFSIRSHVDDVAVEQLADIERKLDETLASLETVRAMCFAFQGRGPATIGELHSIAERQATLRDLRDKIDSSKVARDVLGSVFNGVATPLDIGKATLAYANGLFETQTPEVLRNYLVRRPTPDFADRLGLLATRVRDSITAMDASEAAFIATGKVVPAQWYGQSDARRPADLLLGRTNRALAEKHALPAWTAYLRARVALHKAGGDFVRQLAESDEGFEPATLRTGAELAIYAATAKNIFAKDPELAQHDGAAHTLTREQFQKYDKHLLELERERIAARIDARPVPEGVRASLVRNLTDLALLEHELRKQRAHAPIRQLVNRAGGALKALKPCFMMSPRSVAQYLEAGKHSFDLVIMDEASQLRPEDAIGAVARGSQLVVVGDSKQLPPTNFFSSDANDEDETTPEQEEDEAITETKESILDLARTVFRSVRRLRWHYRSRHASLIAFSNDHYYDNDLVVFPSSHESSERLGVRLANVADATYADGKNVLEAKAIVDAVITHLRERPEETLGVVALNIRQKTVIEELLYDRLKNEPELRQRFERGGDSDGGFIKNLESVQGDERDVIYVSVTYGPTTPGGAVARRFGPINSENGWRRLNVLFTRAKRQVMIFASFAPEQLLKEGLSRGAQDLRDYLVFARTGHYQEARSTGREPDSDFEVEVAETLRRAGYLVTPQVGVAGYFIDLAVRERSGGGQYLLGIECDGAPYHSSFSARDRDRLRQQVLEGLGWKIHRIWSTDWYRDSLTQGQRLLEAVRKSEGSAPLSAKAS